MVEKRRQGDVLKVCEESWREGDGPGQLKNEEISAGTVCKGINGGFN